MKQILATCITTPYRVQSGISKRAGFPCSDRMHAYGGLGTVLPDADESYMHIHTLETEKFNIFSSPS